MIKLCFFANYLNIHQVFLMDEFYNSLGECFRFVATLPRDSKELKGGADFSTRPYCILAGESEESHQYAVQLAREADVCVFGACSQEYAIERFKNSRYSLSFEMGERWLKRGLVNLLSPSLLRWYSNYKHYYRHGSFFKLCCGFYTAQDDLLLCAYKNRHFKWGYFTKVHDYDEKRPLSNSKTVSIMWCSRLIRWKHPELVVQLASLLKRNGYNVCINIYGEGAEMGKMVLLSRRLGVMDVVHFKGSLPNVDLLLSMRQHEIFLLTSDRNEGWGAVLNEAMSNRCSVIASNAVGSAPFIIRDGYNGLLFESGSLRSLYDKVVYLLDNPSKRKLLAEQGYQDMLHLWSPRKAAENLLQLIHDLQNGRESSLMEGPCSKAE